VEFIKGELGDCNCTGAVGVVGEPYATLEQSLAPDRVNVSRYQLLGEGAGHTLFEIAALQKKLGVCSCEGRSNSSRYENHALW
jgi:hypothetical protein